MKVEGRGGEFEERKYMVTAPDGSRGWVSKYTRVSKYKRHQGKKEMARRRGVR